MKINDEIDWNFQDEKNAISLLICDKGILSKGWILSFFNTLLYDSKNHIIRFNDYNFFFDYGIFDKRYVEYPVNHTLDNTIFLFLCNYLHRGYYVILNNSGYDNYERIVFYNCKDEEKKVDCFWIQNRIHKRINLDRNQLINIMSKASKNRDLLTFDMYRPEKLSDCIFSFRVFEEEIKNSYIELSSDFNDFGENIVEVSAININTWIRFMRMKLVY